MKYAVEIASCGIIYLISFMKQYRRSSNIKGFFNYSVEMESVP
jgi:hypothetical protein